MSFLTKIPMLGELIERLLNKVLPDSAKRREMAQEIELEELRQSKGGVTPKMLIKYVVAGAVAFYALAEMLLLFFPAFLGAEVAGRLDKWLSLAAALFVF